MSGLVVGPALPAGARLNARFRISLADALIAASAVRQEVILVHKDPELKASADSIQQEVLPNKP